MTCNYGIKDTLARHSRLPTPQTSTIHVRTPGGWTSFKMWQFILKTCVFYRIHTPQEISTVTPLNSARTYCPTLHSSLFQLLATLGSHVALYRCLQQFNEQKGAHGGFSANPREVDALSNKGTKFRVVTSEDLQEFVHTAAPADLTRLLPWFSSRFSGRQVKGKADSAIVFSLIKALDLL